MRCETGGNLTWSGFDCAQELCCLARKIWGNVVGPPKLLCRCAGWSRQVALLPKPNSWNCGGGSDDLLRSIRAFGPPLVPSPCSISHCRCPLCHGLFISLSGNAKRRVSAKGNSIPG